MTGTEHYHAYLAHPTGRTWVFRCRTVDVFHSRSAATKWAAKHRSPERRMVRRCHGGPACPGSKIPEPGERPELRKRRKRRRRAARLERLRERLDNLNSLELGQLEEFLERLRRARGDGAGS